jgi:hypothetical protein
VVANGNGSNNSVDVLELAARVVTLERQYSDVVTSSASILAEIRSMREDLREFRKAMGKEVSHLYNFVFSAFKPKLSKNTKSKKRSIK